MRAHVRFAGHLHHPFSRPFRRKHHVHRQGALRRAAHQAATWRVRSIESTANSSDDAVETFKELFLGACPKYLTVNPPPYEDNELLQQYIANPPQDPTNRHIELFLSDVKAVSGVVASRNLLKLYTSIDAAKLSAFLGESGEGDKEEEVLQQLMVLKAASRTYARPQGDKSTSLLDGERIVTNNLDFTIDGVSLIPFWVAFRLW